MKKSIHKTSPVKVTYIPKVESDVVILNSKDVTPPPQTENVITSRPVTFKCAHCRTETIVQIPFGCYQLINPGCYVAIFQEEIRTQDKLIQEVHCSGCRCMSGLSEKV